VLLRTTDRVSACPGSKTQIEYTTDPDDATIATDYEIVGTYDALVPQSLIDLYQSGLSQLPETVSSFFDIQTRQWTRVRSSLRVMD
jgi:hypothetical protein